MKSIKDVYKIGSGPSSSHTMGPQKAAILFKEKYPDLKSVKVFLYGSLAFTGKGHLTDWIIEQEFKGIDNEVIFEATKKDIKHPNTLKFIGTMNDQTTIEWTIYSIGGGDIEIEGVALDDYNSDVYKENSFNEIVDFCQKNNLTLIDYIYQNEPDLDDFLKDIWKQMKKSIANGISTKGTLPGKLNIPRKAKKLYEQGEGDEILSAYAYAVNEENSAGGIIVTAPTCGACGVLPATLKYYQEKMNLDDKIIIDALAIAGLFGAVVKKNATVSGAEAGCQAEVGVATSMAAAAGSFIHGGTLHEIEVAAEIGLEHQLGLTCDPVLGYVQVPCIQRNAVGTTKARTAFKLANNIAETEKIRFDTIVQVMYETGKDMSENYRETSLGGLAKVYLEKNKNIN